MIKNTRIYYPFHIIVVILVVIIIDISFSIFRENFLVVFFSEHIDNALISKIIINIITILLFGTILVIFNRIYADTLKRISIKQSIIGIVISFVVVWLIYSPSKISIGIIKYTNWINLVFKYISVAVVEEICFRGMVFQFLKNRTNIIFALFFSSICFGLSHFATLLLGSQIDIYFIINTTLLGIVFCVFYLFFGLLPAIFSHLLIDLVCDSKIFYDVNNSFSFLIIIVILVLVTFSFQKKYYKKKST